MSQNPKNQKKYHKTQKPYKNTGKKNTLFFRPTKTIKGVSPTIPTPLPKGFFLFSALFFPVILQQLQQNTPENTPPPQGLFIFHKNPRNQKSSGGSRQIAPIF
jgi:hypothetical protein